ncbi:MAG: tetratricopeptide repeat protein, partial [Planctomycetota bacterium]
QGISHLQPVLDNSLEDQKAEARTEIDRLEKAWVAHLRAEEERLRKLHEEAVLADLQRFDKEALFVHWQFTCKLDFEGALKSMERLKLKTPEFLRIRETRLVELGYAANFKKRLIDVLNNPRGEEVRLGFTFPEVGVKGKIIGANSSGLQIALEPSGSMEYSFSDFAPEAFFDWVTSAWKLKPDQIHDRRGLAVVCMELGLYDQALEQIAAIKQGPGYTSDGVLQEFCASHAKLLEAGRYNDSDEVEATKRLRRARLFIDEEDFQRASREVDLLKGIYAETKAAQKAKKDIERWIRLIEKNADSEFRRKRSSQRRGQIDKTVQEQRAELRKDSRKIFTSLGRLRDEVKKNLHLGGYHAAHGDFATSTERYDQARRAAERLVGRGMPRRNNEVYEDLGHAYASMIRNYVLLNKKKAAQKTRSESIKRMVDPQSRETFPWWHQQLDQLDRWAEDVHGKVDIRKLRRAVDRTPGDPDAVWKLADGLHQAEYRLDEAYGYFYHLRERHPDYRHVKSGEVLYRLAEICYGFRKVDVAVELYETLTKEYPEHPRVKSEAYSWDVKKRLEVCYWLLKNMGYLEERDRGRPRRRR